MSTPESSWRPSAGDYGVVRTTGWVADKICRITGGTVNHAFMYLGRVDGHDNEQLVEAQPGGVIMCDWDKYGNAAQWSTGRLPAALTPSAAQGEEIAGAGIALIGTPYSMLGIPVIALAQKTFGSYIDETKPLALQPWWARHILAMRAAFCSELVDQNYAAPGGIHLFADGRPPGLVSPQDLLSLLLPKPTAGGA